MKLSTIARIVGARLEGDGEMEVAALRSLDDAGSGDLTFLLDKLRSKALGQCRASALILPPDVDCPAGVAALRAEDPQAAVATLLAKLRAPDDFPPVGVDPRAVVADSAQIAETAAIGPLAYVGPDAVVEDGAVVCAQAHVGRGARLGAESVLHPGARLLDGSVVGRRCRVHCNAVIGDDGYGYYHRDGVHHKIPHAGNAVLEDDVEIGANACVDRAKFGSTTIGRGSKLDNLVQIGHGVQVGRGVLMAGLVGVAGSAEIGDYCVFGGHSGVKDNVTVGPGVQLGAFSAIHADADPKQRMFGLPAIPARQYMRLLPVLHNLPKVRDELRQLQTRLDALEHAAKNDQ